MAVVLRVVLFLARLICVCVMAAIPVHTQDVSLAFSSFTYTDFQLTGGTEVTDGHVTLPSGGFGIARVMYMQPVQFYNASAETVASFRTSFVVTIVANGALADGITFFIAPKLDVVPPGSWGAGLGLLSYNSITGEPVDGTTKVVAIEIDTFNNEYFDPGYAPHVGLDLNSLASVHVSSILSKASDIGNGSSVGVWIEYSALAHEINVSISVTAFPDLPSEQDAELVLTVFNFDLSAWIDVDTSYLGFSASTGQESESNTLSEWNFSTSFAPGRVANPPAPPGAITPAPSGAITPAPPGAITPAPSVAITPAPPGAITPAPPGAITPAPPGAITPAPPGAGRLNVGAIVGLGVGLPVLALLVLVWLCLRWRKKGQPWRKAGARRNRSHQLHRLEDGLGPPMGYFQMQLPEKGFGPRPMAYKSLMKATKGFSTTLGEGGFGGVYKGVLEDGSEVAVKRIKQRTQDGAKQFLAEVTTIGKLSHKNLVPLKGWCYEHDELLIVYEYMPKGSLADHLYPQPAEGAPLGLDWLARLRIIRGVADALGYLHGGSKQSVVHRDIKPSNVMLDVSFVPKLGDFGLAVAMQEDKDSQTVTGTAGTLGYLAPECVSNPRVGPDSDVYSFGVMVLEMVCGKKPVDWSRPQNETVLVNWVWSLYIAEEDRLMGAVCPSLRADCKEEDAEMLLRLGLMCTFPIPSNRPSMRTVTQFLEGSLIMPPLPREIPPHFAQLPQTPLAQRYWDIINAFNSINAARSEFNSSNEARSELNSSNEARSELNSSNGARSGSHVSTAAAMESGLSPR